MVRRGRNAARGDGLGSYAFQLLSLFLLLPLWIQFVKIDFLAAIKDMEFAVEVSSELHFGSARCVVRRPVGDLVNRSFKAQGPVCRKRPLVFDTENAREIIKTGIAVIVGGVPGLDGKPAVQVPVKSTIREKLVCLCYRIDPRQSQLLYQAILIYPITPLDPPLSLRRVGPDVNILCPSIRAFS